MSDAKVALIGLGAMTQRVHLPSLASFPDVSIVGACDLDRQRLDSVADRYGIEGRYTDYRQMVEDTAPDGVYAVGQPHLMYDVWVWCLRQGLNLYVEKPLGLSRHQAEMPAALAEENGAITQVSFQRRTSPLLSKMRDACLERGPIVHAVCEFYKCDPQPFWSPRDRMLDDGVHVIDTLRWICGGDVENIESHCKRIGVPDINWFTATLHFSTGATGVLLCNWASGRRVFRVQMHAPTIACDADPETGAQLYADNQTEPAVYDARAVAGSDELYVFGGFREKNREFIDSLLAGRELTSSPFRDAVRTMEVADRILAQAALRGD
ncbi:Gfo/Idh/MocA family protein [Actinopolymorpha singaporensis]|uniref:Predicted dehydrogenase n=1 Tax=Actinopolymorpha singaporensis TaxID=117157 RepID=A0A1H1MKY9_9ACTN|nr:Gfo/Idh/MocA family oxidoreductase [Actinopolymorpha singaporensis]SDR87501.1 Predicted dehydrogenase [Actinopolymorpha singaporensis]